VLGKEDVMEIQALVRRGVYVCDIARQLGVHPKTVSRTLARGGVPLPARQTRTSLLDLSVSNSSLCGDGELDEVPAVGDPAHMVQITRDHRVVTGESEGRVHQSQAGCSLTPATKHDELLLEHEILGDHRSHAARTTKLRRRIGEVKQGEQDVLHLRVSVGQTPCAAQRCRNLASTPELAIRDPHAMHREHGVKGLSSGSYAATERGFVDVAFIAARATRASMPGP